ncbi:hypothetical protein D3C84_1051360 [compost metagenome]
MQQQQQGRCQLGGLGVAGEFFAEPQPQASQRGTLLASKHQAQGPADEQDQVQPQQTAQGPEDIDRRLPVAECGKAQAGAADDGEQRQCDQRQARALQPMAQGFGEAIAFGQPAGAVADARG